MKNKNVLTIPKGIVISDFLKLNHMGFVKFSRIRLPSLKIYLSSNDGLNNDDRISDRLSRNSFAGDDDDGLYAEYLFVCLFYFNFILMTI